MGVDGKEQSFIKDKQTDKFDSQNVYDSILWTENKREKRKN